MSHSFFFFQPASQALGDIGSESLISGFMRLVTDYSFCQDISRGKPGPVLACDKAIVVKPLLNGHKIVACYMSRPFAHPVLHVFAQSLKPSNFWTKKSQHFFCSVTGFFCIIIWEFLHPFARSF